jgi:hypothetical protein
MKGSCGDAIVLVRKRRCKVDKNSKMNFDCGVVVKAEVESSSLREKVTRP